MRSRRKSRRSWRTTGTRTRARISRRPPPTSIRATSPRCADGILPLFLQAAESKNVNVVPLVKAFFGGIPVDKREDMTGPQVFAGMNRMMRDVMPAVYEALRKTRIQVTKVTVEADGTAVVEYTVRLPEGDAADSERANLHEGRWYLRTKDSTSITIERFRMLLGLEFESGPRSS